MAASSVAARAHETKVSLVGAADGDTFVSMRKDTCLIAVVDDEDSVRKALGRLLRAAGFNVETFASAREFLDASPLGRTSCLVLDIHLNGTSGFELAEQLAADRAAIPIIFITAHDDTRTRERARQAGVAAYLPKPFDERVLLEAIRGALGTGYDRSPGTTTASSNLGSD